MEQLTKKRGKPRSFCADCGNEMVLCALESEKVTPYWRHLSEGIDHRPSNGESEIHKYAKHLLCDFLQSGGTVVFGNDHVKIPKATTIKTEVKHTSKLPPYDTCIFDIACMEVNIGIEILHTHKTTNITGRNDVKWYEVSAVEVINKLNDLECDSVKLVNVRQYEVQECVLPTPIELKDGCKPYPKITFEQLSRESGYTLEGLILGMKSKFILYRDHRDKLPAELALKECRNKKKFIYEVIWWGSTKDTKLTQDIKDELNRHGRCLCCGKVQTEHKICYRPLCVSCFKKKNENYEYTKYEQSDRVDLLYNTISKFLNPIPGNWTNGDSCYICKIHWCGYPPDDLYRYFDNHLPQIYGYSYWKGRRVPCCHVCLGKHVEKFYT